MIGVVAGVAIGTYAGKKFDGVYDKYGRDFINGVVETRKNMTKKIGSAVTGFFGNLKTAIS